MRKIDSKQEFVCNIGEEIFVLISCKGKFEAILLSELEIESNSWLDGYFDFSLKAIGPQSAEEKLRKLTIAKRGRFEKFVVRSHAEIRFNPITGRLQLEKSEIKKIRLAIVDDSKTIRQILRKIFSSDPLLEVVADFESPTHALTSIPALNIDVITLDIHMPEMDGVEFLKKIMPSHPIPTVMISSISMEEGPIVLSALEAGAVDYIQKPSHEQIPYIAPLMVEKIKIAASAKTKKQTAALPHKVSAIVPTFIEQGRVFAIGSSTGGTEALRELLTALPKGVPPIFVVQHIPALFSKAFAERMNGLCNFPVTEAVDGETVHPNHCYIAPGGLQMSVVSRSDGQYVIRVEDSAPVNRHKPSVDVLFQSVAKLYGRKAVGVILTGMGADGASGLLEMKNAKASTFGQNEETCVVYGMPQAAKKMGAVERELPLQEIAAAMMYSASAKNKAS